MNESRGFSNLFEAAYQEQKEKSIQFQPKKNIFEDCMGESKIAFVAYQTYSGIIKEQQVYAISPYTKNEIQLNRHEIKII